jgi:uncharacterized membrane protein
MQHLSHAEISAGMPRILGSSRDAGTIELIVQRPAIGDLSIVFVAISGAPFLAETASVTHWIGVVLVGIGAS